MYRVNILAYLFLLLFCTVCFTYVIPNWTPPYPGFGVPASYVPSVLCGVIAALSLIGLILTFVRKTGSEKSSGLTFRRFGHFLLLLLPIAVSMPLMKTLTFVPGSIIVIAALQIFAGERSWLRIACVSGITAVLAYAGLWYGLHLPLP
ncbi:MAG: tripartite tricarboxylate transporter TctB family protein [Mailhella sp.]|nr:tripartite tricarboxylate transporter TctB family protein [Mailhella sp.]